jgi:hypothetical protein
MADKKSWRDYLPEKTENQDETSGTKKSSWRDYVNFSQIVGENINDQMNAWLKNYNSYVSDYQDRFSGRTGTYEDAYVSDSADWLSSTRKRKKALDAEADAILDYLNQYGGHLDSKTVEEIQKTLTEGKSNQKKILDISKSDNDYWSQWGGKAADTLSLLPYAENFDFRENAYKKAQEKYGYSKKYEGMTYAELQNALNGLGDGNEKEWLTSYAASKDYDEKKKYDVDVGGHAIKTLENRIKYLQDFYLRGMDESLDHFKDRDEFLAERFKQYGGHEAMLKYIEDEQKRLDEMKKYSEEAQHIQKYEDYMNIVNAEDYAINSQFESTRNEVPKEDAYNALNNTYDTGMLFGDHRYDYVNRQEDAVSLDNANEMVNDSDYYGTSDSFIETMTDDEIGVYNYLYKTKGPEAAEEFLTFMQSELETRKRRNRQQYWAELAEEDPVGYSAFSTLVSPLKGLTYIGQATDMLVNGEINENAGYNKFVDIPNAIRSQVSSTIENSGKWGKVGSFAYNTGMSMADFLFTTAVSGGNQALSLGIMGSGAAADMTLSAKDRGLDDAKAFTLGTIAGIAEIAMENISLGAWLNGDMTEGALKYVIKNAISEGGEEAGTSVINLLADVMISADKSEWNQAIQAYIKEGKSEAEAFGLVFAENAAQIGLDTLGGILSGAAIGGGTYAGTSIGAQVQYGGIGKNNALSQQIVGEGLKLDPNNKYAHNLKTKLDKGKNITGMQVRNILAANQEKITDNDIKSIQSAAQKMLSELGQRENVAELAKLATKWATGQDLTRAEKSMLTRSEYGNKVAHDLLENGIVQEMKSGDYSSKAIRTALEHMAVAEITNAYKPLESRVDGETTAKVSDTGEAVIEGTNKAVDLTHPKIKHISNDSVILDVDGKDVNIDDIEFANEDQWSAFNALKKIEHITPLVANDMIAKVDFTKPVWEQLNGMDEAFTYGFYGYSEADLNAGLFTGNLTKEQLNDAYKLGQYERGKSDMDSDAPHIKMRTEAEAKISEKEKAKKQKARIESNDVDVYFMDGKKTVKFDDRTGKYDNKRTAAINTAKFLKKLGIGGKFVFYESYEKNGKRYYKDSNGVEKAAPNGFYDSADGSIYIDLNAGDYGNGTALFTMGHELGHFVKAQSKKQFKILGDIVAEAFDKTDLSMHKRVTRKQQFLESIRNDGKEVSYDEAYEEVVCDALSTMLTDGSFYDTLMEIKVKNKDLFATIKKFFTDFIAKFKREYEKLTPDQKDAQDIRELKDALDKLQPAFAEALVEASENFQAAQEAQKNTTEEGGVDAESDIKLSPREENAFKPYAQKINAVVNQSISGKGNINGKAQVKDIMPTGPRITAMVAASSGNAIDISQRNIALSTSDIWHEFKRHTSVGEETSRGQIAFTKRQFQNAVKCIISPDMVETIFADTNNPTQRQSFAYAKKTDRGHYVVVEAVGGKNNPQIYPVMIVQFSKAKWNKMMAEGKSLGEILHEGEPKKLLAQDVEKNKKSRVTAAQFASYEAIANTLHSPQLDTKVSQPDAEVKNKSTEAMDVEVDAKTESVAPAVLKSERTWTSSAYVQERDKAAKEIAKAIGVTEQKAKDYIDSINSIAKMIADDRSRLDYFSSPNRTSFVGNVEYGGSFDFSTLCKKRRLLTGTFTAIQKALPNTALTANEILDIRNRMKEANLEVSCGLCYVEGSRANMGQFTKEFLRLYKQYYPDAWQPNMADVNTPDGIEWVRINHPECYEQYEYFWNHYGTLKDGDKNLFASQQKPKLYQLHTEYKGEILDKFKNDDNVEEKNLNGGIRLQSFSDFEIVHLIDTMQIIMDMSRVGLAGQAYTKVPDFAWALGDTGLKINLSLIAKGVDENGKLIFDDVEGMPIAEAMKLRDRYSKNVGTILVAFNDQQLLAAMADDKVDFIIPFHRSQWKKSQYEAMGLPAKTKDYTFMQNEKFIKPQFHEYRGRMVKDKATNYMPNEYWDFSKSGKENAEAYLEMCARNNKRPKFYKLLQNNGDGSYSLKADGSTDGYWKLLIDFKMYDNEGNGSPQIPVKPEFNMEESNRMLNDYKGGHSNFPVAHGIVDSFVKDYKASHKGVKFSDRDSTGKQLTKEQLRFFKDSKVRDENGNLLVMYHGTKNGDFTVFDHTKAGKRTGFASYGKGNYFTVFENGAAYYGGRVIPAYLKIVNPVVTSANRGAFFADVAQALGVNESEISLQTVSERIKEAGYDGVIVYGIGEDEGNIVICVAYDSAQIKEVSNKNPTSNPDIRYSERGEDSSKRGTAQQDRDYMDAVNRGDMETAKKMVEEAAKDSGYTVKVYHGTNAFGFTVIDTAHSDDGMSFFATESLETAGTYSKMKDVRTVSSNVTEGYQKKADDFRDKMVSYMSSEIGNKNYITAEDLEKVKLDKAELHKVAKTWLKDLYNEKYSNEYKRWNKSQKKYATFSDFAESSKYGKLYDTVMSYINGFHTNSKQASQGIYEFYANTDNLFVIDCKGEEWNNIQDQRLPENREYNTREVCEWAREQGYDGVKFENVIDSGSGVKISPSNVYAFFRPKEQVKSADPVTYDEDGNVIPLSQRFNKENDDIRYSERGEDSSNRGLLANAFEGITKSSIEYKMIQEYKGQINKLNKLDMQLSRLNSRIREIRFGKGKYNAEKLQMLENKRDEIAAEINKQDKILVSLEASAPLKRVIERERKKEAQKTKEHVNEILQNKKVRAEQAEYRYKIRNFKKKLEGKLLRPTDRQYVPVDLIKAMVEVCEIIDTDTDLYKADGSINKSQVKRDETKEKLQNLKDEYEKLKTNSDPIYAGEFDEMVYTYLTELRDNFSGKSLMEMSVDELAEMYEILRAIDETLADARKLIGWGDAENVYEAGDAIVAEQNAIMHKRKHGKRNAAQKGFDKIDHLGLSPVRNVERMSAYNQDSALLKLFKKFEQGIRKKNKFKMDAYKSFEQLTSGKEYDDAVYKEVGGKKYTDVKGRKFGVSKMQMMQAILSWEREQANENLHHIENGGFTFADLDMLSKGKLKDAVSAENSHRVPAALDLVAEFQEILKDDKWCQDYMAAARSFFNGMAKDAINETSIALKHRIIAKDKSYIPFEVDKNFVNTEITDMDAVQKTINSYGMLKDTVDNAPQALYITGLNNILDRHIEQVGTIYGLAIEVRNFNKVWNVRSKDEFGNDPTVKESIDTNWGKGGVKHIEQAVKDIQGPRVQERNALYDKVKSGYIGSTFLLNLSVVTKQIGSLFSATSMLKWRDPGRMIANLIYTMANHKKISAEVDKYTATAWMRRQGMSDAELHTLMTERKKTKVGRLMEKAPAIINPTKWITAMDHAVALSLWRYAKQDTAKRTGLKGETLLKATAEFYDELVENTQSMTDVLHRPEIQKSGNVMHEAFAMFKTDLYQMAGQLQSTAGRYMANKSKENGISLGRTVYSIAMGAIWGQLMTTVFALLRYKVDRYRDDDDEEEKLTVDSWLKRQGFGLAGDLMGYVFPIFGSEVVGVFENIMYGERDDIVDNIALTAVNDLYSAMITLGTAIKDGEMPDPATMRKFTAKALQVFGIPANNILRTLDAIQLHAEDIANGEFLSFNAGVDSKADDLYEAIVSGNKAAHAELKASYVDKDGNFDQTKYASAVVKALRENDPRIKEAAQANVDGNAEKRNRILKELKSDLGSEYRDFIVDAINAETSKIRNDSKPEKVTGQYEIRDFIDAVADGDSDTAKDVREDIIDTHIANDKTQTQAEQAFVSSFVSGIEEAYSYNELDKDEAKNLLVDYADMEEEDAADKITYWDFKTANPDSNLAESKVMKYLELAEPAGVSLDVYEQFVEETKDLKDIKNEWGDVDVSKQEQVIEVIDSLPLSWQQKDALFLAYGYSKDSLWKVTW